jgi:hypothetical protein
MQTDQAVTRCSLSVDTNVSEEYTASFFRVEVYRVGSSFTHRALRWTHVHISVAVSGSLALYVRNLRVFYFN